MSHKNTVSQQGFFDRGQPVRLSRRRLLATGAGALAVALPVLATATGLEAEDAAAQSAAMDRASDRQRRIAAILDRHGPELGSRG